VTIYLLRHSKTEWNTEHRFQGHLDSPLTDEGIAQAHTNAAALRALLPEVTDVTIDSSPLGRARKTAEIVADAIGIGREEIRLNDLLKEASFGVWQGLTWEEVAERFPGEIEKREATRWTYRIPEGEPYCQTYERAQEFLRTPCPTRTRVVVAHEVMSRCIRGAYAGLTPEELLDTRHPHDVIYRLKDGRIDEIS